MWAWFLGLVAEVSSRLKFLTFLSQYFYSPLCFCVDYRYIRLCDVSVKIKCVCRVTVAQSLIGEALQSISSIENNGDFSTMTTVY